MRVGTTDWSTPFDAVTHEAWKAQAAAELKGAPFEKRLVTRTYEGVDIQPLYVDADWPHAKAASGFSGMPPMTRGGRPLSTVVVAPDVRQERREPLVEDVNAALLDDLIHGAGSVLLRLDVAGRHGLDADDPRATGLVGRDGVSVSTVDDLDRVFQGVHLEMITVALEAGAAFSPAASLLMALWERRGLPREQARGAFNADPLAVLARDGSLPTTLDAAMSRLASLAVFAASAYPQCTAIRVGTAPYHHAGATATQDLAFSMATGVAYLRALTAAGMPIAAATRQMVFSYALGTNQFLAIAKLRAARRLWARIVQASGGAPVAQRMLMHARPSKRVLTHRDPWVNILRNSACCFAACVAGADIITSTPFDDAIQTPTALSRRIARNTPTILTEESHLTRVADTAGGSWYLERLTDDLAEKAWAMFQDIERRGGMADALTSGWVQAEIDAALAPRSRNLAVRQDAVLGVTEFANPHEPKVALPAPDPRAVAAEATARLIRHRAALRGTPRFSHELGHRLEMLHAARGLPVLARDAAAAGASIGQIADALGFGEATAIPQAVTPHPYAAPFEELRDAVDAFEARCGYRPRVFLVNLGTAAEFAAREGFARGLFETGGFEVVAGTGHEGVADAAGAFAAAHAAIAVICSTDDRYGTLAAPMATALHAAGARTVLLAGRPGAQEAAYRAAGIDRFIFMKCDALAILRDLLREEGVL